MEKFLSEKVEAQVALSNEREARNTERFASSEKAVSTAFSAAKEAVTAAMAASEKAVSKAEAAADKRSDASNEIRAAMIDQQKTLASKSETDLRFDATQRRLDAIERAQASAGGQSIGASNASHFIFKVIPILVSIGVAIFVIVGR